MSHTPTPQQLARGYSADEIRARITRIRANLANPAPGCRGAALAAARRDAAKAIAAYRAALALIRAA